MDLLIDSEAWSTETEKLIASSISFAAFQFEFFLKIDKPYLDFCLPMEHVPHSQALHGT